MVCILRPDPSLWSLLGAQAAPSQLLVCTINGAVHLLQQAPGPIKTKNGTCGEIGYERSSMRMIFLATRGRNCCRGQPCNPQTKVKLQKDQSPMGRVRRVLSQAGAGAPKLLCVLFAHVQHSQPLRTPGEPACCLVLM